MKSSNKIDEMFKIYKCSCGKTFIPSGSWVYKLKIGNKYKYYCSYSCWRKAGGDGGDYKTRITKYNR